MQHLFAAAAPGLEAEVAAELFDLGYSGIAEVGGVSFQAPWDDLLSLNQRVTTASRILVRFANFKALHLSELTRNAKRLPWAEILAPGTAVRVKATCRKSKIYHSGAAAERVQEAIAAALELGDAQTQTPQEIMVRIEQNACEISLNSSGEHLHKRGYKLETAKAPLRETLAAGMLRMCGWTPEQALIDPMCGSGTFPIEAAVAAAKLWPGHNRTYPCSGWPALRALRPKAAPQAVAAPDAPRIFAYDRDAGAIAMTQRNAERAGVLPWVEAKQQSLAALKAPAGVPGLVMCNPPWGERVGDRRALQNLYAKLGHLMSTELKGWRLGLITTQPELARATGLKFTSVSEPLLHGGLRIRLYQL